MPWFFERNKESLKLELRYDDATSEFVAIVHYPDGRELTNRFTEYGAWLETFEYHLEHQHWTRHSGGPVIVPYGWPKKRLQP